MKIITRWLLVSTTACLTVPVYAQTSTVGGNSATELKLEEVIVTAQKREERLQEVPMSISVLGGSQLDSSTVKSMSEALNQVPGVAAVYDAGTARIAPASGGAVVIRGVAPTGGFGAGTVGYYLDSIPFSFNRYSYSPDPAVYDLDRVEVLRGPQGTLYGVTALNGVVRILTKEANLHDSEFKARASVSDTSGGGMNYQGDAAANIPLIAGKLAMRAVVGYQKMDGWIDKPGNKNANDSTAGNYRFKLNAKPTDELSLGASAWFFRSEAGAPPISANNETNTSPYAEPASADFDAYAFKIGYDFSAFTLTSATSYIDFNNTARFDFAPFTVTSRDLDSTFQSKVSSEEVLLSSKREGPWHWSLGGLLRRGEDLFLQTSRDPITRVLNGGFLTQTNRGTISKSYAVFGEVTRQLFDGKLDITGGLRYFRDEVTDTERARFNFIDGTINPLTGLPGLPADQTRVFKKTTPRAVLTWHPQQDMIVYASYSEGFRSGLNQAGVVRATAPEYPSAKPDSLVNYELGTKGSVLDGRVNFDAAVYYIDWKDVQQSRSVPVTSSFTTTAAINADAAKGAGAELGITAKPTDGLTFGANFSWNDLKVTKDVVVGGVVLVAKDDRLVMSPEYTLGFSADYAFPLSAAGWSGRFSTSANYLPSMIASRNNAATVFIADSVWMTRASFGIESGSHWSASLYVNNLTNDGGQLRDSISPAWNTWIRPRTVGVQLEFKL